MRVAVTHIRELRKLVVQLGKERCVILREPLTPWLSSVRTAA